MSQILKTDSHTGGALFHDVGNNKDINTHIMFALKDSGSSINLAVDGTTPKYFYIQPPVDEIYTLRRMNIRIIAASFVNAETYAGIAGAGTGLAAGLTNGLRVFTEEGDVAAGSGNLIVDYTADRKIKVTSDWALLAGVDAIPVDGPQADPFLVRWTFAKSCGHIILDGSLYERLVVSVEDNLSPMSSQINMVSGTKKIIT